MPREESISPSPIVLNTRPVGQAAALSQRLREAGFSPVEAPAIRVVRCAVPEGFATVVQQLRAGGYGWVVFPSANAARFLRDALEEAGAHTDLLARAPIVCGTATAEVLSTWGLEPGFVLREFSARAVVDLLQEQGEGRALVPRARRGREEVVAGLRAHGYAVDDPRLYDTLPAEPTTLQEAARLLEAGRVHAVTLASPSAVEGLYGGLAALGRPADAAVAASAFNGRIRSATSVGRHTSDAHALLSHPALVCIGRTTAEAVLAQGLVVAGIATETTLDALVQAVRLALASTHHDLPILVRSPGARGAGPASRKKRTSPSLGSGQGGGDPLLTAERAG